MRFMLLGLIWTVLSTSAWAASESGVILVYHHVAGDTPPSTSLSPKNFAAHLEYLQANDFNVISLPAMVDALANRESIPDKSVAITFDDGYASIYDTAFPMLQEYGYPFTLFVSTGPIDRGQSNYMTWEHIAEMAAAGVTIANHLVEHPYMLERLSGEDEKGWLNRLQQEILQAQNSITEHTGQTQRLLAYPYGEYNNAIKNLVSSLEFTGLAQNSGAVGFDSDFAALPRFPLASIYANLDTAKIKFASKAFNVEQIAPTNPLSTDPRPLAKLKFSPGNYLRQQIACFSNGEAMSLNWSDEEDGILEIKPKTDLRARRSRYVCTAPDTESNQFYWYSVQWINPNFSG